MKPSDYLSERMIFGTFTIVGLIALLHELLWHTPKMDPSIVTLVAGGVGALVTGVGVILNAVFKSDKSDKQNADTMATLAAKMPDGSGKQ